MNAEQKISAVLTLAAILVTVYGAAVDHMGWIGGGLVLAMLAAWTDRLT